MGKGIINPDDKLAPWRPKSNRDMTPKEPNYVRDRESFKQRISEKKLLKEYRIIIIKNRQKNCDSERKTLGLIITYGPYKGKSLAQVAGGNPLFVKLFIEYSGFKFKQKVVQRVEKFIRDYRLDQKLKDKYV